MQYADGMKQVCSLNYLYLTTDLNTETLRPRLRAYGYF